jgi:hypothetical protein
MGSDEDTTDGGTGKKSAEQVAAIFRKSKKVMRTPSKDKEKSQEDKMQWRLVTLGLGSAAEPKSKYNNK